MRTGFSHFLIIQLVLVLFAVFTSVSVSILPPSYQSGGDNILHIYALLKMEVGGG